MGRFSFWEITIIVVLILLIFGGRKLPELGRALGKGIANFRSSVSDKDGTPKDAASKDKTPSDDGDGAAKG
ncbi:MAG: twin-arginine translocase TatA/TatE family subunit [Deltaproteobacteria bacterium]|jgi:sec-independent protein translocase protein TatA|nr:twin-arginine translocase TatA/TatE family subunit [Deltaproteobacteria bacterium]